MDPVTSAIIAALTAGVLSSTKDVAGKAIVDAYEGLKTLIARKFGDDSQVAKAVKNIEEKPDSKSRVGQLEEEIAAANVNNDPEIQQAAKILLEQIGRTQGNEQHIQEAIGNYIAQADRGSNASVNINASDKPKG